MWNSKRSATLSLVACAIVAVLVILLMLFLPQLIHSYAEHRGMTDPRHVERFFANVCRTVYPAAAVGLAALYFLVRMLRNIAVGTVFAAQNVTCLRVIAWCCFVIAAIAAGGGIYYVPFMAVAAAAAFVGLIVRVMKNLMGEATALREDRDLTI